MRYLLPPIPRRSAKTPSSLECRHQASRLYYASCSLPYRNSTSLRNHCLPSGKRNLSSAMRNLVHFCMFACSAVAFVRRFLFVPHFGRWLQEPHSSPLLLAVG